MLILSKYTRSFLDIDSDIIIFNTYNKGIVSIPKEKFFDDDCHQLVGMSDDEIKYLTKNHFLEGTVDLQSISERYESLNTLIISLELFLHCNLACPYCYQTGGASKHKIREKDLDYLFTYIQRVHQRTNFKTLVFKVLGGEPMIDWSTAEYITSKCFKYCESNGIIFKLMIDTNGTIKDSLLSLSHYHSVTLTIPLTEEQCHNKNRRYSSGLGTYNDIINNTNQIYHTLNNVNIVLRYNIDSENILVFEKYVNDIKYKLSYTPIISPNYTMEFGATSFHNRLKHQDVVNWRSSVFIDILVANDFPIVVAPYSMDSKCQYGSRYSLKLFSDGTVGPCAMSFWDKNRPYIGELCNNIEQDISFWPIAKSFNPFANEKCQYCSSLFLCGGAFFLPCSKMLDEEECENRESFHINLKLFLSRYLKYTKEGKGHLFIGFNDNETYK